MEDRLRVELVAIGTEVVYGLTLDTNTHWLAQQVVRLGGDVRRVTKIHDERETIQACFREAIERGSDLVISTGGLGGTQDDITNAALADLSGSDLIVHEGALDDFVRRRGLASRDELPPHFVRMATVPASADVLRNEVGWAPGLHLLVAGTDLFALPGPPREMEAVFVAHVLPYLTERSHVKTATTRLLIGLSYESQVAPHLDALMEAFPGAYLKARLGSTPRKGWLPVDVLVVASNEADAKRRLQEVIAAFQQRLAGDGRPLEPLPDA